MANLIDNIKELRLTSNERIKKYLIDHHYNQSSIAREMGMPIWQFNRFLNNKRTINADELLSLSSVLGVSIDTLLHYQ